METANKKFDRYKKNLSIVNIEGVEYVKSYDTLVAVLDHKTETMYMLGWWSKTTSKHINYVVKELNYKLKNK